MAYSVSPTASISKLADITPSSKGSSIQIGEHVFIDSFVRIRAVGGEGDIQISNNCFINSGCVIFSGNGVFMGEWVLVGPNCTIAPTNHSFGDLNTLIRHQGFTPSRGGVVIEDNVWIGAGSILLDGAIVRTGAVIGAGSLVRGEVAANCVYAGNPLRFIRHRADCS